MATDLQTAVCHTQMGAIITAASTTAYIMVWSGSPPAKSSGAYVAPTGTLPARAKPWTSICQRRPLSVAR